MEQIQLSNGTSGPGSRVITVITADDACSYHIPPSPTNHDVIRSISLIKLATHFYNDAFPRAANGREPAVHTQLYIKSLYFRDEGCDDVIVHYTSKTELNNGYNESFEGPFFARVQLSEVRDAPESEPAIIDTYFDTTRFRAKFDNIGHGGESLQKSILIALYNAASDYYRFLWNEHQDADDPLTICREQFNNEFLKILGIRINLSGKLSPLEDMLHLLEKPLINDNPDASLEATVDCLLKHCARDKNAEGRFNYGNKAYQLIREQLNALNQGHDYFNNISPPLFEAVTDLPLYPKKATKSILNIARMPTDYMGITTPRREFEFTEATRALLPSQAPPSPAPRRGSPIKRLATPPTPQPLPASYVPKQIRSVPSPTQAVARRHRTFGERHPIIRKTLIGAAIGFGVTLVGSLVVSLIVFSAGTGVIPLVGIAAATITVTASSGGSAVGVIAGVILAGTGTGAGIGAVIGKLIENKKQKRFRRSAIEMKSRTNSHPTTTTEPASPLPALRAKKTREPSQPRTRQNSHKPMTPLKEKEERSPQRQSTFFQSNPDQQQFKDAVLRQYGAMILKVKTKSEVATHVGAGYFVRDYPKVNNFEKMVYGTPSLRPVIESAIKTIIQDGMFKHLDFASLTPPAFKEIVDHVRQNMDAVATYEMR